MACLLVAPLLAAAMIFRGGLGAVKANAIARFLLAFASSRGMSEAGALAPPPPAETEPRVAGAVALPRPAVASAAPATAPRHARPALLLEIAERMDGAAGDSRGGRGEGYLEGAVGGLPRVEAGLAPILTAQARGPGGRFDGPGVRHALHRYFVREFGWRLSGLDPLGGSWNSSSPSDVVALQRLPDAVRDLVAERLDGPGFNGGELAVLAWTLKYLIQDETDARLHSAYSLLGLPLEKPVPRDAVQLALNMHLMSHITNKELDDLTKDRAMAIYQNMTRIYPSWGETLGFIGKTVDAQRAAEGADPLAAMPFDAALRSLAAISERYGLWQDRECRGMKGLLLPFEEQGSGRVRLADFYRASLGGQWQFSESLGYLRQLGALDETEPTTPRVIIPNYLLSFANCVGSTAYNDICCISECEGLMAHIERSIAGPSAEPAALESVVAALPSSTVPAGRRPDIVLAKRLREIAAQHEDGRVPIHGRLFAQWMHHAYPRECPYPHAAGATKQVSAFHYVLSGQRHVASRQEMNLVASRPGRRDGPRQTIPWDVHEELVGGHPRRAAHPFGFAAVHATSTLVAMAMLIMGLARMVARRRRMRGSKKMCVQIDL
eukprot:CAMPEP_0170227870 /NCGR_PEP_ID=MMETSP0116_2-20130129/13652_1 /TAXON_ID=400756 /ORGANISM="Durinskia baltica, Strain CSIRO CS-38" /LENGTH=607 /DNA_ID=CAMNT_0010478607 /DNA_START=74 /DNA_END=1897 /DNA_ORIENTATION=+